jgi:hypothetical protein
MTESELTKFGFRIRTRDGSLVDNLAIAGRDEEEAVRKLRQMYRDCEILECAPLHDELRTASMSFETIAKLIND